MHQTSSIKIFINKCLALIKMEQKPLRTTITLPLEISVEIEKYYRTKLMDTAKNEDISDIPTLSSILIDLIQKGWSQLKNTNINLENLVVAETIKSKKYVFRLKYHQVQQKYYFPRQTWFDLIEHLSKKGVRVIKVREWKSVEKYPDIKKDLVNSKKYGEEIRYIHQQDIPKEITEPNDEFYLFDDVVLIITKQNKQGILDEFEYITDKEIIKKYIEYKNQILEKSAGKPLT